MSNQTWRRELLVLAFQRAVSHWGRAARLYEALAQKESSLDRKAILQALSDRAEQRAADYDRRLQMLHANALHDEDAWQSRLWRWLLLRLGARAALTWLDWDEKGYLRLLGVVAIPRHHK